MKTRPLLIDLCLLIVLVGYLWSLSSCSFCSHGIGLGLNLPDDNSQFNVITSPTREIIFEDNQNMVVYHGSSCTKTDNGKRGSLTVEESLELPAYITNATVYLNGWHLKYLNDDHHVAGLGTAIDGIKLEGNTLKWKARGAISDHNFDDPYSWCYYYTVIAWNASNIHINADDNNGSSGTNDILTANWFNANNTGMETALSNFPSFLYNPDFPSSKKVAILPRGFGFNWNEGCADHHLLQLAYNLDHSEIYIQNQNYHKKNETNTSGLAAYTSRVDSGFVSWNTQAIFKDNDTRRNYNFGEIVSGIGGHDIDIIEPPHSISPIEDSRSCIIFGSKNIVTHNYTVKNIPFTYAIPVLTGWNLEFSCKDHHVKEIGTWIDKINYEKREGEFGTLTYSVSSVLNDNSGNVSHASNNVSVLGFNKGSSSVEPIKYADLVPYSPFGSKPENFCRKGNNRQLKISIKNTGTSNATATKTAVIFNGQKILVDTPPIASNSSTDILVNIPNSCFIPNCSFVIKVDSNNQINEHSGETNNSVSGICKV